MSGDALPAVPAPRLERRFGRVHWLGIVFVVRRDLGRVLKEWPETILAPVFSTLVYIAVFTLALGPAREGPEGAAALTFALPGLVALSFTQRAIETTAFSLTFDKMEGSIADVLMPPLSSVELTLGYVLAGMAAGLITGAIVLAVVLGAFGLVPALPLIAALFAALGTMMLTLAGILIGISAVKWDHVAAWFVFAVAPVTMLSGVFAPVDALPAPLDTIMQLNPIFYVIGGFRAGVLGEGTAPIWLSLAVSGATALALWLAAVRLVAKSPRLRP